MRVVIMALVLAAFSSVGWAQWSGSIQTFTSDVQGEEVAPLPVAASPTAQPATPSTSTTAAAAASPTSPFTVKGLVVSVSGSTGFDRDAALDQAARTGLEKVLLALPLEAAKAKSTAKTVGDPQRFVASYVIVKETLVPTYSLTVDMTYNESMLRNNFGGKVVVVSATAVASGTSAVALASPTLPPAAKPNTFVVRLANGDPGAQDKVYQKLRSPVGASIRYRVATSEGAEWDVTTPLSQPELEAEVQPLGATVVSPLPAWQAPQPGAEGAVSPSLLNPAGIY